MPFEEEREMMEQITEAERIVRLMLFVRENGPVDFSAIRDALPFEYGDEAGTFDATRRRFERDKKTLQESGVFFSLDDQQRYSLNTSLTIAAPLSLSNPQISLLRLLCGALLQDKDYPLKEDLRMILVKLGDELEIPDMLPQMNGSPSGMPKSSKEPQRFSKIRKAIASRKLLTFSYANSSGYKSERAVEPFGCFFLKGVGYLVAYDPSIDEERIFRLDRMKGVKVNGANPSSPDFDAHEFIPSRYYGLPFQFGQEDFEARIFFDAAVVPHATQLMMNQGSCELRDGGIVWTVTCKNSKELSRWCIENGPGIHVLSPECARTSLIVGLRAYIEQAREEIDRER